MVNLTKHVQNLYVEKYKTLMRETKDSLNKQTDHMQGWKTQHMKKLIFPKVDIQV